METALKPLTPADEQLSRSPVPDHSPVARVHMGSDGEGTGAPSPCRLRHSFVGSITFHNATLTEYLNFPGKESCVTDEQDGHVTVWKDLAVCGTNISVFHPHPGKSVSGGA